MAGLEPKPAWLSVGPTAKVGRTRIALVRRFAVGTMLPVQKDSCIRPEVNLPDGNRPLGLI
jgi:hypothetical protein